MLALCSEGEKKMHLQCAASHTHIYISICRLYPIFIHPSITTNRDGAQNGAVFAWHQDQAYWQVACACSSTHRNCCTKLTPRRGAVSYLTNTITTHHRRPQVNPQDTRTATISLAINDADTENGCLRVVPGSHTEPTLRRHRPLIQSREGALVVLFGTWIDGCEREGRDRGLVCSWSVTPVTYTTLIQTPMH